MCEHYSFQVKTYNMNNNSNIHIEGYDQLIIIKNLFILLVILQNNTKVLLFSICENTI